MEEKSMCVDNFLRYITATAYVLISTSAYSAVTLDRTRIVFNGSNSSVSIAIQNKNQDIPFLAQAWLENAIHEKVKSPFMVIPPIQRLEPTQSSQIRIEVLEKKIDALPQDRESLFYFNLRELPPKSDKPNILQFALQNKLKLFYRPTPIVMSSNEILKNPWQEKLEIIKKDNKAIAKNPTPYFTTILSVQSQNANQSLVPKSLMIAPFSEAELSINAQDLGEFPTLTYINDLGGTPKIKYQCHIDICQKLESQ